MLSSIIIMGTGGDFSGCKAEGSDADHSPPSTDDVKNGGAVPPLPHIPMA
jgi:hypothetical protein